MLYIGLITLAFAVLRFIVPVTGGVNQADVFKDLAHIWVGGLFGMAIIQTKFDRIPNDSYEAYPSSVILWCFAIGITIVEVVAFFVRQA